MEWTIRGPLHHDQLETFYYRADREGFTCFLGAEGNETQESVLNRLKDFVLAEHDPVAVFSPPHP